MSALNITLWAVGVPLVIFAVALPSIFAVKAYEVWRKIPREIYAARKQQLLGLGPIGFWITVAILSEVGNVFESLGWETSRQIADGVSSVILITILVYHFVWAMRIVRSRMNTDARLLHFARYALWGSGAWLLGIVASVVFKLSVG